MAEPGPSPNWRTVLLVLFVATAVPAYLGLFFRDFPESIRNWGRWDEGDTFSFLAAVLLLVGGAAGAVAYMRARRSGNRERVEFLGHLPQEVARNVFFALIYFLGGFALLFGLAFMYSEWRGGYGFFGSTVGIALLGAALLVAAYVVRRLHD